MRKTKTILTAAVAAAALSTAMFVGQATQAAEDAPMTFFITSSDQNGNLGGLAGADALCQRLAQAAGSPATRNWSAYLSTQGEGAVNARDRIGNGPWHAANGTKIADSVADLHSDIERDSNYVIADTGLDENGETIPGRFGRPEGVGNKHDILTGSDSRGMAFPAGADRTCNNWTSGAAGNAMTGHYDRSGGGQNTSWNAAHPSRSCSLPDFNATGGAGKIYCFATN